MHVYPFSRSRLVSNGAETVVVLLILMLQKLAHLTKLLVASVAVVWEVRHSPVRRPVAVIVQHGSLRQIPLHLGLLRGKTIDLLASIILSSTASTVTTLHMLNGVGTRPKASIATNGAGHITRTMNLLMHVEFILIIEGAGTFVALVSVAGLIATDTVLASRTAIPLQPLISTERPVGHEAVAVSANSSHLVLI